MTGTNQPWKNVWPAPAGVADQATTISPQLSHEEMTNQRSFGSHASNTKGRIVHIKKTTCEPANFWQAWLPLLTELHTRDSTTLLVRGRDDTSSGSSFA